MNNSYRLWNLWDMLEKYGVLVSWLTGHISQHQQKLEADVIDEQYKLFGSVLKARRLKIDGDDVVRANTYLPQVEKLVSELNLESTAFPAKRIRSAVKVSDYPKHRLAEDVGDLLNRLHDDLSSRQFIFINSHFAQYYKQANLFGQAVNDSFPAAIDDIEDAGTALATGLATSCVLHLVRVLEVALKTLASELDIPYVPSWEAYLSRIEKSISAKHSDKTPEWLAVEKFYRDVSGDLLTVKQAWRNPSVHVERRYNVEEAELALLAVKAFMQRMAKNLTPKEQPILTLVANNQASDDN